MRKIFIILSVLFCAATTSAQMIDHSDNLQFSVGGGIHSLLYTPDQGQSRVCLGALASIQYQRMFNHYFGFGIGVEANTLKGRTYLPNYAYTQSNIMLPGALFPSNVTTQFLNWTEQQKVVNLSVPVQFLIQAPINIRYSFQLGLGFTINHPLAANFQSVSGSYSRKAYAPITHIEYTDLPNHGLGTFGNKQKGDITSDIDMITVGYLANIGFLINLNKNMGVYLGIYGNYSNHNINKASSANSKLSSYDNNTRSFSYNGLFASNLVKDVTPLEIGVKIALRFGVGKQVDWRLREAEAQAIAEKNKADSLATAQAIEAERQAANRRSLEQAMEQAKARAEAKAKAQADSIAAVHAAELAKVRAEAQAQAEAAAQAQAEAERLAKEKAQAEAKAKAETERLERERIQAELKAKAEAQARAKAVADSIARAKAEQKAREEAAFLAGFSDTAYFATGSDTPTFGQLNQDSWDNLKDIMSRHPEIHVTVTGHTDNVGAPATNLKLSQRRADNIAKMLVEHGVPTDRIHSIGVGQDNPIASNKTASGRSKNRCIIITIRQE